jgi:hypothetical protein
MGTPQRLEAVSEGLLLAGDRNRMYKRQILSGGNRVRVRKFLQKDAEAKDYWYGSAGSTSEFAAGATQACLPK